MNRKIACLIVLTALLASGLACNLPLQLETPAPPATPSSAATEPQPTAPVPSAPAGVTAQPTPVAPVPSATAMPTATETNLPPSATATFTATFTATPTDTKTPTRTPTRTRIPRTPTAPATLTPEPKPTRTRTAKPNPSGRTVFTAVYFSRPPVLDGLWDEWKDLTGENPARSVVYGAENWTGPDDLDASFRVAWDDTYLYLAAKVRDDVYAQNATEANLYLGDSLEILLDRDLSGDLSARSLSADDYQLGISAGSPDAGTSPEAFLWFPRASAGARGKVKVAALRQDGVTRIEAAVPWSVFGIQPTAGDRYGFAFSASDNDALGENAQQSMVSSAPRRSLVDPTTWNELRLK